MALVYTIENISFGRRGKEKEEGVGMKRKKERGVGEARRG